jgi:hypothetical protein
MSLFVNYADHQKVRDFAVAELRALDGLTRHVALTAAGSDLVDELRAKLLALVGDVTIVVERGSVTP